MPDLDRPPDFYWEGQARWKCPDCQYDGISARDVERHGIVHRHEQVFRERVEAGLPQDMEAAIRAANRPESQQKGPSLFDYANRPIKP